MIITVIKAEIEAEAGWAVGTSDADAIGLDQELLIEPGGRPWVPPSSLAGSLRAHLTQHGADERLMGSRPSGNGTEHAPDPSSALTPSALWVLGTRASRASATPYAQADGPSASVSDDAPAPLTDVVASTAVDPERRAAVPKSLRHARVVDETTVIEFYAQLEGALTAGDTELLAGWQPQVGRGRTRGGSVAQLRSLGYRAYDLGQPADLRAWLGAAGPDRFKALTPVPVKAAEPPPPPVPPTKFLLSAAMHVGTGSRREKRAAIRTRGGHPLVPASTWKGLFRARAGYIIRSCWGEKAACIRQAGCGKCPVCRLFGSTTSRGRIAFRDSEITHARPDKRSHVAIDRISGGGRDKLLFTDDIVTAGEVALTITSLGQTEDWERDLLLHVVRDIHDGLIGIGGGAQRGQGTLHLADASHPALTALRPMPAQPPVVEAARD